MEFGKLASIDGVNFSLPLDPAGNALVLKTLSSRENSCRFYIGATGWHMREWVGKWYPAGCKPADYLRHYAGQFNSIEHNTTYYRIPDAATAKKWRDGTPGDFRFCAKLPQVISHSADLGMESGTLNEFCRNIRHLDDRLGCSFLQLPPSFGPADTGKLLKFLRIFPKGIPLAIELRSERWFAKSGALDDLAAHLTDHGVALVVSDVAGRRDVVHMRLTAGRVLVRFVGNGLHPTDYQRIDEWVSRLKSWIDAGLREVFFFCHEPDNVLAPELAVYLLRQIAVLKGVATRGPRLQDSPGSQMSLFG
jgi:uncharacterized protein YecE (DUF72 family)